MTHLHNPEILEILSTYALLRDPWRDWTPTVTQGGAVAFNLAYARYVVLADTVAVALRLQCTSAGTAGNAIVVAGVPSAIQPSQPAGVVLGSGVVTNSGTIRVGAVIWVAASSNIQFLVDGATGFLGANPSFALANLDIIEFQGVWER